MSINEDFNPNPKRTLVDYVDDSMLEIHKKIATVWQNKTHLSKRNLEKRLRVGGAAAWAGAAAGLGIAVSPWVTGLPITRSMLDLITVYLCYNKTEDNFSDDDSNKEKSSFDKGIMAISYLASIMGVMASAGDIVAKIISKKPDANNLLESIAYLSWSIGFFQDTTAYYLSRIKIENPPKKKKKEVWQEVNKKLEVYLPGKSPQSIPQPLPQPAPKPSYIQPNSNFSSYD